MTKRQECQNCSRKSRADEELRIHPADVGKMTDLFWAVADVYNTEKHLEFSLMKIRKEGYGDKKDKKLEEAVEVLLNKVRIIRAALLKKLLGEMKIPYQLWCSYKHLTGATMQIMEVATRDIYKGDLESGKEYAGLAYDTWNVFWELYYLIKFYNENEDEFYNAVEVLVNGVEREAGGTEKEGD